MAENTQKPNQEQAQCKKQKNPPGFMGGPCGSVSPEDPGFPRWFLGFPPWSLLQGSPRFLGVPLGPPGSPGASRGQGKLKHHHPAQRY